MKSENQKPWSVQRRSLTKIVDPLEKRAKPSPKKIFKWCTGMTLRNGMGRDVAGSFRMGDTCTPMADSCQCLAKTTTIL